MRLLPFEDLKRKKGIPYARAHIWRLEREGKFPKHLRLGKGGRNAWVEDEIDAYVAKLIAERDEEAA
jgi:prophage regulatory protein